MNENETIKAALAIIEGRIERREVTIKSPEDVHSYVILQLSERKAEAFSIIFLDNRHRVIEYRELFQGTIDGTSVYPREVIRAVLEVNAAAVVLVHNHPSGVGEPSAADERITNRLRRALELIDVRLLDHLIVAGPNVTSFASRGLI